MQVSTTNVKRGRAFTLTELVTVMTITAILTGVLWSVGVKAVVVANHARTAAELRALNNALEEFCHQFGDYPPDFHDPTAARRFLATAFPKCRAPIPNVTAQSPATALFFWLAGPKGNGFSANPAHPFDDGPRRIGPFIKFAPGRLRPIGGGIEYLPPGGKGQPYVYFRGGQRGYNGNNGWAGVHPYRSSVDNAWINGDRFQIISPGDDGKFGGGHHFPAGGDYDEANYDDISNFSGGGTMKDAISTPSSRPSPQPKKKK